MSPDPAREHSWSPRGLKGTKASFTPLHPFVGARVNGLDLAKVTDQEISQLLAPALETYGLLLFPAQELTPPQFFEVLRRFPDVDQEELNSQLNPFAQMDPSCLPELPTVRALGTQNSNPKLHRGAVPETNHMGPEWHSDGCGLTGLYAAEVPGSEDPRRTTWWASGYRAWDLLDSETQEKVKRLRLRFGPRHTLEASVAEIWRRGGRMTRNGLRLATAVAPERLSAEERQRRLATTNPRRYEHFNGSPVRRHPFTDRLTLWSLPVFLDSCEGMESFHEAGEALEQLLLPGTSGDSVYVHEWSPGDFVVWDNRSTLHSTTDVIDAPQLMYQAFLRTKTPMRVVE